MTRDDAGCDEGCELDPADLVTSWLSTTNPAALDAYARAVRHACEHGAMAQRHLAEVLAADPNCEVASIDLRAPAYDRQRESQTPSPTRWERQHIEIVTTASRGEFDRAEALLRDHISEFGCDPLALLAVITTSHMTDRLDDLRDARCRSPWTEQAQPQIDQASLLDRPLLPRHTHQRLRPRV